MGGATAGNCSDCPALDGNRNIVSCWDGGSHFPSVVAKLLWDVVFITQVSETLVLKIGNIYLVTTTICWMLLFKKQSAFSDLFFVCVVDPSGLV